MEDRTEQGRGAGGRPQSEGETWLDKMTRMGWRKGRHLLVSGMVFLALSPVRVGAVDPLELSPSLHLPWTPCIQPVETEGCVPSCSPLEGKYYMQTFTVAVQGSNSLPEAPTEMCCLYLGRKPRTKLQRLPSSSSRNGGTWHSSRHEKRNREKEDLLSSQYPSSCEIFPTTR